MCKIFKTLFLLLIYILVHINPALADAGKIKPYTIELSTRYINESDVENQAGDFSLFRSSFMLRREFMMFDKLPVGLGFSLRNFSINDDTEVALPSSLESKTIWINTGFPAPFLDDERYFIGIDLMPGWKSAEDHSFRPETFRFNSIISLAFKKSETFVFAYGFWIRPEYEVSVVPFVGFRYVPFKKMTLNFLSHEPHITYEITPRTRLLLEFNFLADEFEVTDGARKGDIVRIQDREIGLGLERIFNDSSKARISAGWAFSQSYEYLNAEKELKPDNAFYLGAKLLILF